MKYQQQMEVLNDSIGKKIFLVDDEVDAKLKILRVKSLPITSMDPIKVCIEVFNI